MRYTWYLLAMSLFALALMGYDKGRAKAHLRRVPEKTLWLVALLGGGPGAFLAMHLFRHKTRHASFFWGLPLVAALQIALLFYPQWKGLLPHG